VAGRSPQRITRRFQWKLLFPLPDWCFIDERLAGWLVAQVGGEQRWPTGAVSATTARGATRCPGSADRCPALRAARLAQRRTAADLALESAHRRLCPSSSATRQVRLSPC
jgi:hypothetical protein